MKENNNLIAVLLMIKNEQNSITTTISSFMDYFKHVIIYDTGSTDNTINILIDTCKTNNLKYYIKKGTFKGFPESRNDAIQFAETISVKYLLLLDAGDEFRCAVSKSKLYEIINQIPNNYNYGLVRQDWIESENSGISNHIDIRFIRNKANCRYDLKYPVHEIFQEFTNENTPHMDLSNILILFQDRVKHGQSTINRYSKDIELLLKAEPNKRNLYFLAQTYMSIDDYKNGFKYNVLSLKYGKDSNDDKFTLVRTGFCAMKCGLSESIVMKYLLKSISLPEPPVDSYIYILKYYIDINKAESAVPYMLPLAFLEKPIKIELTNHLFYDYTRWKLIAIVSLLTKQNLKIGKMACLTAVNYANNSEDINNLAIFDSLSSET